MSDINKARYRVELVHVWSPAWNAQSLVSNHINGSTLTDCSRETRDQIRQRRGNLARQRQRVQRDFAYYRGDV